MGTTYATRPAWTRNRNRMAAGAICVASRLRDGSGPTSAGSRTEHTLRLRQVIADIDPENVASIAVARKLGFTDSGPTMYAGRQVTRYVIERAGELE